MCVEGVVYLLVYWGWWGLSDQKMKFEVAKSLDWDDKIGVSLG